MDNNSDSTTLHSVWSFRIEGPRAMIQPTQLTPNPHSDLTAPVRTPPVAPHQHGAVLFDPNAAWGIARAPGVWLRLRRRHAGRRRRPQSLVPLFLWRAVLLCVRLGSTEIPSHHHSATVASIDAGHPNRQSIEAPICRSMDALSGYMLGRLSGVVSRRKRAWKRGMR